MDVVLEYHNQQILVILIFVYKVKRLNHMALTDIEYLLRLLLEHDC